jgi:hypothetical protein
MCFSAKPGLRTKDTFLGQRWLTQSQSSLPAVYFSVAAGTKLKFCGCLRKLKFLNGIVLIISYFVLFILVVYGKN